MCTLAEIKATVTKVADAYEKRICKAIVDNQNVDPVIDCNGRYHAPCDNYIWINDEVYMGGNYLPDDDNYCGRVETMKLKILVSLFEELNDIIPGSMGKSWIQDGQEIAYFYGLVTKAEKTALLKILPEGGKRVVLADENTTSKTWKFSTGKFTRRFSSIYGFEWMDIFEALSHEFAPGVKFEIVKKKDKYTFKSEFDGKMVCYQYLDNIIKC
jgi:hypothetical protein